MLKKIKFSHTYVKFKGLKTDKTVTLIWAMLVHKEDLSEYFLEYDTKYYSGGEKHNYPLKPTIYLMLFFMDPNGKLFTTLRRNTPEKESYYRSSIGQQFKVIIGGK